MMKCPFCRAEIPDDSSWCDQCGKPLMFCPECGRPKRGTMCAACGVPLVTAEEHFSGSVETLSLCGEGLTLPLKEGEFGRAGGIWPELGGFRYISSRHGRISRTAEGWTVTDLGSTNGTFVGGVPLAENAPCPLHKGDIIEIATSKFTVK